ncbi:MAG: hypothetical protein AABX73_01175, partial [Nanoarchaeota archaeon]
VDFFERLAKTPEKVAYGYERVKKALEYGAVERVIIVESMDDKIIDEFEELASKSNSEFHIVSIDTQEGLQLKDLGGVGAVLRYQVE